MCSDTTLIYFWWDCMGAWRRQASSTPGLYTHHDTNIHERSWDTCVQHGPTYEMRKQSVKQSPLCPSSQNDLLLGTVSFPLSTFFFISFLTDRALLVQMSRRCFWKTRSNQPMMICWQFFLYRLTKQDWACLIYKGVGWWILFSLHASMLIYGIPHFQHSIFHNLLSEWRRWPLWPLWERIRFVYRLIILLYYLWSSSFNNTEPLRLKLTIQ